MVTGPDDHRAAFQRGAWSIMLLSLLLGPCVWLVASVLFGLSPALEDREVPTSSCLVGCSFMTGLFMAGFALWEPTVRCRWEARAVAAFYSSVLGFRVLGSIELSDRLGVVLSVACVVLFIVGLTGKMPPN